MPCLDNLPNTNIKSGYVKSGRSLLLLLFSFGLLSSRVLFFTFVRFVLLLLLLFSTCFLDLLSFWCCGFGDRSLGDYNIRFVSVKEDWRSMTELNFRNRRFQRQRNAYVAAMQAVMCSTAS